MRIAGGSDGSAEMSQVSKRTYINPWLRRGQTADTVALQASADAQSINEISSSPPDDLSSKILRQVEFYFSDANILKDQFMLKSVKSNKDGWMKLSIIAGFNRIQSLTKDEREIRDALKVSNCVEVSDDGMLIRRKNPLPEWDRLVYTRTVLVSNFASDEVVSVDSVLKLCKSMNLPVVLVRIVDAGKEVPRDLAKSASIHGYLGVQKCAVVEFESRNAAQQAVAFFREAWPKCYSAILSYNPNKSSKPKEKNRKNGKDKEIINFPQSEIPLRPQIVLTSSKDAGAKVVLIREPRAPQSDESVGFEPDWRETLRLQRSCLQDADSFQRLSHSTCSDEFLTPQASSPLKCQQQPGAVATGQLASQFMLLDEAIASLVPMVKTGEDGGE
uniref:HTH La-type RNA-binding domain-containing protein n=1 Tax=Mesocestoides corti TaxID=53468 RepID=A0A5K3EVL2_MESCO